jgi:flagellar M-ring protein FliF
VAGKKGKNISEPWSDQELAKFTTLVKEAVGFNAQRGDSVQVINAAFQPLPELEPVPEPPLWEQPWLWTLLKQVTGGIGVLLLIFGVIKPVMRGLAEKGVEFSAGSPQLAMAGANIAEDQVTLSNPDGHASLPGPGQQRGYDYQVAAAKGMAQNDPKRVAQVMKNWVNDDG